MVASPVLMQVQGALRPLFDDAVAKGKIPKGVEFRIMSFPISGERNRRRYRCVDRSNNPLSGVKHYDAVPTISD